MTTTSFLKGKILPCLADILLITALVFFFVFWALETITVNVFAQEMTLTFRLRYLLLLPLLLGLRVMVHKFLAVSEKSWCAPLKHPLIQKLTLTFAAVFLFLGLLETMLGIAGYDVETPPVIFELTNPEGVTEKSKGYFDPEYIFAFRKGEYYDGVMINSLGYREREIDPVKEEGAVRVICMGDSVTAQGRPGYCGYLHEMLSSNPPTPQPWEAFNMAVYGYSSVQGLRVFQDQAKQLKPDIVTIFYGWNDHWLEMQKDRDRMARRKGKFYSRLYELFQNKRVFMLVHNLIIHGDLGSRKRDELGFRVPPDDYKDTLRRFVAEVREIGGTPLLITAPRRTLSKVRDIDVDFNIVHDEYVEYTRQVAEELQVDLLDLYAVFSEPEYDIFFSADAIHFRQGGLEKIAVYLDRKIRNMVSQE